MRSRCTELFECARLVERLLHHMRPGLRLVDEVTLSGAASDHQHAEAALVCRQRIAALAPSIDAMARDRRQLGQHAGLEHMVDFGMRCPDPVAPHFGEPHASCEFSSSQRGRGDDGVAEDVHVPSLSSARVYTELGS